MVDIAIIMNVTIIISIVINIVINVMIITIRGRS